MFGANLNYVDKKHLFSVGINIIIVSSAYTKITDKESGSAITVNSLYICQSFTKFHVYTY
jgi:hypothetical protein